MEDYGTLGQSQSVGGFAGAIDDSTVINCYATGNVVGTDTSATRMGGFVGYVGGGASVDTTEISYCYATGTVLGEDNIGGFVGLHTGLGFIRKCYATGALTCTGDSPSYAGGFVGESQDAAEITDCYSRGNVTMESSGGWTAGFNGKSTSGNDITNCYSTGAVSSDGANAGGFGGQLSTAEVISCYWDTTTSGYSTSSGGTGYGTTLMKTKSTYVDWDFTDIWYMVGTVAWRDTDNSNNMGANSVCVIPGTTEDEVWITITRAINDNLVRYVERIKPRNWGTDQEDCFFVDSGLTYDSTAATTFSGLHHLEGEEVAILGDGAVMPSQTVSSGSITLPEAVSVAQIGLAYTYPYFILSRAGNYTHAISSYCARCIRCPQNKRHIPYIIKVPCRIVVR
jgi:hypothetical protein